MSLFYHPYPQLSALTDEPILVEINARLVPIIINALERYKYKQFWASEGDYIIGVNQLCIAQEALLTGVTGITEAIDRVYRLLDTSINGRAYAAPTSDPADITPAIPLVPENALGELPGLRRQLEEARGMLPGGFLGFGARPPTLADVVLAIRQGSEEEGENLLDRLDLLGDAGDVAGIFNVVRGTVLQGLEAGAQGGILATLVVSTMSQAALGALLENQIIALNEKVDRVIEQLGVPAAPAPANTIGGELGAMRELLSPEPYTGVED